jgi:hypothetical protein
MIPTGFRPFLAPCLIYFFFIPVGSSFDIILGCLPGGQHLRQSILKSTLWDTPSQVVPRVPCQIDIYAIPRDLSSQPALTFITPINLLFRPVVPFSSLCRLRSARGLHSKTVQQWRTALPAGVRMRVSLSEAEKLLSTFDKRQQKFAKENSEGFGGGTSATK